MPSRCPLVAGGVVHAPPLRRSTPHMYAHTSAAPTTGSNLWVELFSASCEWAGGRGDGIPLSERFFLLLALNREL